MNIQQFIEKYNLTMTFKETDRVNENFPNSRSFEVEIKNCKNSISIPYYIGSALDESDVVLDNILESLSLDCSCTGYSFEEFCDYCGYNTDSIKALKIYNRCKQISRKMKKLIGERGIDELLEVDFE